MINGDRQTSLFLGTPGPIGRSAQQVAFDAGLIDENTPEAFIALLQQPAWDVLNMIEDVLATLGARIDAIAAPLLYTKASIPSLTEEHIDGTTPIVPDDPNRKALVFNPPADCTFVLAPGDTTGFDMIGGVPNPYVGRECPKGDLFIVGLNVGDAITIMRA